MLYFIELAAILAYMVYGYVGIILMLIVVGLVAVQSKSFFYKSIKLMILSSPMAAIGIMGINGFRIISWYNIFLIIFLLGIMRTNPWIEKRGILIIFMLLLFLLVGCIWSHNLNDSIVEIIQWMMMLVPIVLVKGIPRNLVRTDFERSDLIECYVNVCVIVAISMAIQYMAFTFAHQPIGIIEQSGMNRFSFMVLFHGPNVPILVGSGFVILLNDLLENKINIVKIAYMVCMFLAIVLNSARSGLFCTVAISGFCILRAIYIRLKRSNISFKSLALGTMLVIGGAYGVRYLTVLRNRAFFDSNGRDELARNGYRIWTYSIKNFFFGEGFSGGLWEGTMSPHNVIIQTLAECGLLFSVIVFIVGVKYLYDIRKSPYIYAILYVLLYGMFVTEFYANSFTTVLFILVAEVSKKAELSDTKIYSV